MTDYDNTNRGVLFKNNRKEPGDKKPDYTGSINVAGVEHYLDAWIKDGQKGKFMSISIKPKEEQQERRPEPRQAAPSRSSPPPPRRGGGGGFDDMDDDSIPFCQMAAGRAFLAM